MAQKYRKIDPRIWGDEKFSKLSPQEKLVALYCLTCPQCNRVGIFRFSPALAAEDLGMGADSYAIRFRKVCETMKWRWDETARVLYLPTWWRYNAPENPKHLQGCLTDLHDVPQTPLLKEFVRNIEHLSPSLHDTYRIAIPIAMPYQELEQEQEQEQEQDRSCSENASRVSEPADPLASVPVLTFPVVGKGPTEWTLTQGMLEEFDAAYPAIDTLQEARNARQWCIANARKRKTYSGMPAFLTRWLTKAQNAAGGSASQFRKPGSGGQAAPDI